MVSEGAFTTQRGRRLLLQQREQYATNRREREQEDLGSSGSQTQAHLDRVQQGGRLRRHYERLQFVDMQQQIAREALYVSNVQPRRERLEDKIARLRQQRREDIDRVELHAREVMDGVRHNRVLQRRQLWELNVARRKARTLEDLDTIRRRCEADIA